jgi:serine/threonine protein kinase
MSALRLAHALVLVLAYALAHSQVLRNTKEFAKTQIGTPYYLSPEICNGQRYNNKSDIWSLGILLFEMCSLKQPFTGNSLQQLVMAISRGKVPPIPAKCVALVVFLSTTTTTIIITVIMHNFHHMPSPPPPQPSLTATTTTTTTTTSTHSPPLLPSLSTTTNTTTTITTTTVIIIITHKPPPSS